MDASAIKRSAKAQKKADAAPSASALYDSDFYSWTQQQAELLRSGRLDAIDIEHVIEEIDTLGRSERSALESAYRSIVMHLLKMRFQPEKYSHSRYVTVMRERVNTEKILDENSGLKSMRAALFERAYDYGRRDAAAETRLPKSTFPEVSPFSLEQVESEQFLPDEARTRHDREGD